MKRVLVSLVSKTNGIFNSVDEFDKNDFDAIRDRIGGFLSTVVGLTNTEDGSWHGDRELCVCVQGNEPVQFVAELVSACFLNGVNLTLSYLDRFDRVQRQKLYY